LTKHARYGIGIAHSRMRRIREPVALLFIITKLTDWLRERGRLLFLDQHTVDATIDEVGDTADLRGDNWYGGGHRFEDRYR
jgi:hypothetical protein